MSDWIPNNDGEFDDFFKTMNQYVGQKCQGGATAAWTHIPEADRAALVSSYAAWYTAYAKTVNEATRTRVDTEAKNEAKEASKKVIRSFVNRFLREDWPQVTNQDRTALQVPNHDKIPTPHPVPSVTPAVQAVPSGIRRHTVTAINPETEDAGKPHLVKGVAFAHRVRNASEPKAAAEDMPSVYQAETSREFQYAEADYGRIADYACAYENESGQRGPWSDVISLIIA